MSVIMVIAALGWQQNLRNLPCWYSTFSVNELFEKHGNLPTCLCNARDVGPLQVRAALKLIERMPKGIRLSTTGLGINRCAEGYVNGSRKTSDCVNIRTSIDKLSVEKQYSNVMPDRSSSCRDMISWQNIEQLLGYCSSIVSTEIGKVCHGYILKSQFNDDKIARTSLVNMYAKCGEMETATLLFDEMVSIDVATCNCLISGYASNGMFDEAVGFFARMGDLDLRPNDYTYTIMLSACGISSAVEEGRQFHGQVVKLKLACRTAVTNSLMTMYSKCGMKKATESLFYAAAERNLISWTAFISALHQQKAYEKALLQFNLMRDNGIEPNEFTYSISLSCCGHMKECEIGRALHAQLVKNGMVSGSFVGTAIVDLYAKLGQLYDAEKQLMKMGGSASTTSWNAMVNGFVCNEKIEAAMGAFRKMVEEDIGCDEYTYSIILKACSSLPSLAMSKQVHSGMVRAGCKINLLVASSLMEAYAKCGNLEDAEKIFYEIPKPDVVSWNTMIKAYSQYGYSRKAILLFRKMVKEGIRPSSTTFLAVLSACSHSGLVPEGQEIFTSMTRDYRIPPEEMHYSCMVDLLSRSGQLKNALDFINKLPIEPTAAIWRPFLAGCWIHRNLQLAETVANYILELDPNDAAVYVTLSNMYVQQGRLDDALKQREQMESRVVRKEPGCSWIEVNNRTFKFFSGDKRHPDMPKVYKRLKQFLKEIKHSGSSRQKYGETCEEKSLHHSEKLAVCFGLLNLPSGSPVRVFKNIRVCSDCHKMMKHISNSTNQEIILRDNYRFHHFKNGCCSCRDFW